MSSSSLHPLEPAGRLHTQPAPATHGLKKRSYELTGDPKVSDGAPGSGPPTESMARRAEPIGMVRAAATRAAKLEEKESVLEAKALELAAATNEISAMRAELSAQATQAIGGILCRTSSERP